MRLKFLIIGLGVTISASGQTLGGSSAYTFLNLSNTPQLTGLGGVNVSQTSNDVGMAFFNPALLQPAMHTQMNAVFNSFFDGITASQLSFGFRSARLNTNFLWGVHYFSYGSIDQTDAAGNVLGSLHPVDWTMQIGASRKYLEKWNYGASLKFINSNYGQYRSSAIAADVGVLFHDSTWSASVVAKNMGFQLKRYMNGSAEDLPFDLIAGVSKKLAHAPLSFSITIDHLHQFDTRYNDTVFNNENGFATQGGKFVFDKIFRHFVLASQVYVGDHLEISVGYNHLRRQELNIDGTANGLNGFSVEVGALFSKIQIRYGRAYYQKNLAYNQFGLNLQLNKYFGLGRFGERIGW